MAKLALVISFLFWYLRTISIKAQCIGNDEPCAKAIDKCCDPDIRKCLHTKLKGWRCYKLPDLWKPSEIWNPYDLPCIPKASFCAPKVNDLCCYKLRCKVGTTGPTCDDAWTSRKKDCAKNRTHHAS